MAWEAGKTRRGHRGLVDRVGFGEVERIGQIRFRFVFEGGPDLGFERPAGRSRALAQRACHQTFGPQECHRIFRHTDSIPKIYC
jgi:hypothetical protein